MGNPRICVRQSTVIWETSAGTSRRVRRQLTKSPQTTHEESVDNSQRVRGHLMKSPHNRREGSPDQVSRIRVTSVLRIVETLSLCDYD